MKRLIWIITIVLITVSCTTKQTLKIELRNDERGFSPFTDSLDNLINEINFRAFTIRTPKGWSKLEFKGVDSYVGGLLTDNNDTISFDLGWYSNKLNRENEKLIMSYDTIDNYKVKIVKPKIVGNGFTGIYIDSLWMSGSDKDRFNLIGYNLCEEDQNNLLKVIKTIRFDKKKYNQ